MTTPSVISCRWDWCRSTFTSIDALDAHVKHQHIWPMKPMRKSEIALMRRIDLQSFHSSLDTQSSIISTVSNIPPPVPLRLDQVTQSSSPPPKLPASPAFEVLPRQNGRLGQETIQHVHLTAHHRPLSGSSGSSQEMVEQELTQTDDVGSQSLLLSDLQSADNLELRWPTDDEFDPAGAQNPENLDDSEGSTRGQNFHCGSLDVPPDHSTHPPSSLDPEGSQPFVLQTQAPYSSPTLGWSESQP